MTGIHLLGSYDASDVSRPSRDEELYGKDRVPGSLRVAPDAGDSLSAGR
jgi:hypothetical protein